MIREMRNLLGASIGAGIGVVSALALVIGTGQAEARQTRHLTLRVGDSFVVAGTDLACQTQVGREVIRGKRIVTCFKVKGGDLAAGSYVAVLGANGRVVVASVDASSNIAAPIFDRTPAGVGSGAKQIIARIGDQLRLGGTNIFCVINNDASGVYPTCFRGTGRGGVPGSYAFAETSTFVAVVKFDATGKGTKVVLKRAYGR